MWGDMSKNCVIWIFCYGQSDQGWTALQPERYDTLLLQLQVGGVIIASCGEKRCTFCSGWMIQMAHVSVCLHASVCGEGGAVEGTRNEPSAQQHNEMGPSAPPLGGAGGSVPVRGGTPWPECSGWSPAAVPSGRCVLCCGSTAPTGAPPAARSCTRVGGWRGIQVFYFCELFE